MLSLILRGPAINQLCLRPGEVVSQIAHSTNIDLKNLYLEDDSQRPYRCAGVIASYNLWPGTHIEFVENFLNEKALESIRYREYWEHPLAALSSRGNILIGPYIIINSRDNTEALERLRKQREEQIRLEIEISGEIPDIVPADLCLSALENAKYSNLGTVLQILGGMMLQITPSNPLINALDVPDLQRPAHNTVLVTPYIVPTPLDSDLFVRTWKEFEEAKLLTEAYNGGQLHILNSSLGI